jgi:hypothetical protein
MRNPPPEWAKATEKIWIEGASTREKRQSDLEHSRLIKIRSTAPAVLRLTALQARTGVRPFRIRLIVSDPEGVSLTLRSTISNHPRQFPPSPTNLHFGSSRDGLVDHNTRSRTRPVFEHPCLAFRTLNFTFPNNGNPAQEHLPGLGPFSIPCLRQIYISATSFQNPRETRGFIIRDINGFWVTFGQPA